MLFKEVIGHQRTAGLVMQKVKEKRTPHAQLITGPEGSGLLPFALAYAQFILCTNKQENDACGRCPSCLQVKQLQHPDLHFSFPIVSSSDAKKAISDTYLAEWRGLLLENPYFDVKDWRERLGADNKQLLIGAHEAQNILKKLSLSSYSGGSKVMIIYLAERMNVSAANKLLKLLEEPSPGTVFLMISEDTEQLLATIISRLQTIKLSPVPTETIEEHLRGVLQQEADVAGEIASFSDGNVAQALALAKDDFKNSEHFQMMVEWMRGCYNYDVKKLVPLAEAFHKAGREHQKEYLEYVLHFVRQCIVANYGRDDLSKLTAAETQFAAKFSPFINHLNVVDLSETIEEAHKDIGRNVYARIVFLHLSYLVHKLLKRAE